MKVTLREPRKFFEANVPENLQKDCVRLILEACQKAEEQVVSEGYDYEVQHDHYPYERRSKIEQYFTKLQSHPGVTIGRQSNKRHTAYHSVARINNVVITVSKVSSRNRLPRIANFRNELAGAQSSFSITSSNQIKVTKPVYPAKEILYSIIIYGVDKRSPAVPTFIEAIFPDKLCTNVLDRINLYSKYAGGTPKPASKKGFKMEQISDDALPKLKEQIPIQPRLLDA